MMEHDMNSIPTLYKTYFVDTGNERKALFELVQQEFPGEKALYPGSFVHICPSFYVREVVYMDMDKRCKSFFSDRGTMEYITRHKIYREAPIIRFHEHNFEHPIDENDAYFDVLISQYAGFISKYCTRYLKKGGILVVNDSHGDATFAYTSQEYDLIAVIENDMSINYEHLEKYFCFKRKREIDLEKVIEQMKGPKYKNMASSYIFKKR